MEITCQGGVFTHSTAEAVLCSTVQTMENFPLCVDEGSGVEPKGSGPNNKGAYQRRGCCLYGSVRAHVGCEVAGLMTEWDGAHTCVPICSGSVCNRANLVKIHPILLDMST